MIKWIAYFVMLIYGSILMLVFDEGIIGNIWLVGAIIVCLLPGGEDATK